MSLKNSPYLKSAILAMPQKEKDKLLLRLVNKDNLLLQQLHFRLLEDEDDLQRRTEDLKALIKESLQALEIEIRGVIDYRNFKTLNNIARHLHGAISLHEKVTRDKISDMECRLLIITELFGNFSAFFNPTLITSGTKFQKYISGRVKHILQKYDKLHEDIKFDYQDEIEIIEDFIEQREFWEI